LLFKLSWELDALATQQTTYAHYSHVAWDKARWPNFEAHEFACNHCGQLYYWPDFFDRIQWVRTNLGLPINFNSAHRCDLHNVRVGGAPLSQHKKLAVDIDLEGHDRRELAAYCKAAGFTGFGYYNTFLHVDLGRTRFWYGKGAKASWQV